jgi:nitrite reductase/ring-hydroxylating ferredoxin subunit
MEREERNMSSFRCASFVLALAVAGCVANPAPVVDAGAERTLEVPPQLEKPGSQVKIQLPGLSDPILVWRTEIGFGAADLRCTHCRSQLQYNPEKGWIDCLSNSCRYRLDGSVLEGPANRPLRVYLVDLNGTRLRILG